MSSSQKSEQSERMEEAILETRSDKKTDCMVHFKKIKVDISPSVKRETTPIFYEFSTVFSFSNSLPKKNKENRRIRIQMSYLFPLQFLSETGT